MRPTLAALPPAAAVLTLLAAGPALAQSDTGPALRQPAGEYGCVVEAKTPCRGRIDFNQGRSFEFTIPGPGEAVFLNEGNRRCTLEYSVTESALAATGRQMNLGPGQSVSLPVQDAGGMIVRFFHRGLGSTVCDMAVTLKG